jgi:hypothetical protein
MTSKTVWLAASMAIALGSLTEAPAATLILGDFLTAGDQLLVTDTSTNLQWLKPLYTAGDTFNDSTVQAIIATYGFQYATEAQVVSMINNNFNNPPLNSPGTAAGFADVQQFFNVFGINANFSCSGGPCPRTQGLTSTSSSAGTHVAVGMIQVGPNGYMIDPNPWPDGISDTQVGSWLIRSTATAAPEPVTSIPCVIGLGLLAIGCARRRSRVDEAVK